MEKMKKLYDAHLEYFRKVAFINSREQYENLYERSIEDLRVFGLNRPSNI